MSLTPYESSGPVYSRYARYSDCLRNAEKGWLEQRVVLVAYFISLNYTYLSYVCNNNSFFLCFFSKKGNSTLNDTVTVRCFNLIAKVWLFQELQNSDMAAAFRACMKSCLSLIPLGKMGYVHVIHVVMAHVFYMYCMYIIGLHMGIYFSKRAWGRKLWSFFVRKKNSVFRKDFCLEKKVFFWSFLLEKKVVIFEKKFCFENFGLFCRANTIYFIIGIFQSEMASPKLGRGAQYRYAKRG